MSSCLINYIFEKSILSLVVIIAVVAAMIFCQCWSLLCDSLWRFLLVVPAWISLPRSRRLVACFIFEWCTTNSGRSVGIGDHCFMIHNIASANFVITAIVVVVVDVIVHVFVKVINSGRNRSHTRPGDSNFPLLLGRILVVAIVGNLFLAPLTVCLSRQLLP